MYLSGRACSMQSRRGCPKNGSHLSAQKLCVGVTGGHRWGGWVAGGKKRGGGVENRWRCGKEGPLGPRHNETGGETGTDEDESQKTGKYGVVGARGKSAER